MICSVIVTLIILVLYIEEKMKKKNIFLLLKTLL